MKEEVLFGVLLAAIVLYLVGSFIHYLGECKGSEEKDKEWKDHLIKQGLAEWVEEKSEPEIKKVFKLKSTISREEKK